MPLPSFSAFPAGVRRGTRRDSRSPTSHSLDGQRAATARSLVVWAILAYGLGACSSPRETPSDATPSTTSSVPTSDVDEPATTEKRVMPPDPHSAARPELVRVERLELDADIDFSARVISARARWALSRASEGAPLILDTAGLEILAITGRTPSGGDTPLSYTLGALDPIIGRPLEISLPSGVESVSISYRTALDAGALQWLSPEQTADRRHPFLFTQSQAILARTWVPCQDTPSVRFTYEATVRVPSELSAVMAASNLPRGDRGEFRFRMDQRVPSYLLALAVGDLEFRPLSERCGVWAERSVVERAADELADTEKMVQAAEDLYGPYRWERYDLLILPPSFPWGGMENPRLTFCTPTILAGDRSLVSLIAHELAHSWSGNLVTNARWNDFWLNEGFTVYVEHRIMERLYGKEYDEMLARLGYDSLSKELGRLPPVDTHLQLDLAGRAPDDAMTDVPYEKGYLFLRTCEELFGRADWDRFLRSYFDRHAFASVTSEIFLDDLHRELLARRPELEPRLDARSWVYGPGIPAGAAIPRSPRLELVAHAVEKFVADGVLSSVDAASWSPHEWVAFLEGLPRTTPVEHLAALDASFSLTSSTNGEMLAHWLALAAASGYAGADPRLDSFVTTVGRRKFLVPIYTALCDRSQESRARARALFEKARSTYHSISVKAIEKIVSAAD
jgi:leukotriene-A4 hydrolase